MLGRGNTIVGRQIGEGETDTVRIHNVHSSAINRTYRDGYCMACGHWSRNRKKIGNLLTCDSCQEVAMERIGKKAK